ncbi:acyltransferase [Oceanicoccus sp. KOV_DT_Chl]|uniref:acyltransferase family protein n=1 Tax=Oceanicoccus sp. KOV_DT_Chl TaxID=1904639 RepID=UPI000C7A6B5D|nr:acyltransferase [Oceanicoccus sp. KOV_DT_Chl]
MNRNYSIALDAIRVVAAAVVFLSHFSYLGYTGEYAHFFHEYGHVGVVMFFVLSGYVIAYVCEEKHKTFSHYMTARLARLYSVLLFCLILTVALDFIGRSLDKSVYRGISFDNVFLTSVLNILFLQQALVFSAKLVSNGPLWSLSYEFFYYLLFGVAIFYQGGRRIAGLVVVAIVAGPKILLLMPCWIIGVMVRRWHVMGVCVPRARISVIASVCFWLIFCYIASLEQLTARVIAFIESGNTLAINLAFSKRFLLDYFLSCIFGLFLWFVYYAVSLIRFKDWFTSCVDVLAKSSFSLYLYHVPLILFFSATGWFDLTSAWQSTAMAVIILLVIYWLSLVTEYKIKWYRDVIQRGQISLGAVLAVSGRKRDHK